ncbi:MAG: hypothetical protein EOO30_03070 [Comamonadaceae bacterium]|nr:MAG: hypothetical protein EOO30_03070 [Comamonadaceae bacterium]
MPQKKAKAAAPRKTATAKKPLKAAPAAKDTITTQSAAVAAPAPQAAAKTVKAVKAEKVEKTEKPRKPKLVRDSFTIPKDEYAVLELLKERAAKLGRPTKKSEVLRAGVQALAGMTDSAFLASVGGVPALKTGRPAKA